MKAIDVDAFLEHELKRCKSMPYIGTCTTNNFTLEYELSKQPTLDVIPRSVYEQIKWERDIAMQQLEENGIAFGAASPWISVKEYMPKDGIEVLTLDKNGRIANCNCVKSYVEKYGNYDGITYWMPLPKLPIEES